MKLFPWQQISEIVAMETPIFQVLLFFFQIVKEMILLYNDSLLAVETCGLTDSELRDVIGERLARDLLDKYIEGRLAGCRHNPGRRVRCNTTNSKGWWRDATRLLMFSCL